MRTTSKLKIAKFISFCLIRIRLIFGLEPKLIARRGGIKWSLDLREGIDLAIYIMGVFERKTVKCYQRLILPGYIILDIGANIGAHTLHLATCTGKKGRVIAFEPTNFAFQKLSLNVSLNPKLKNHIELLQTLLTSPSSSQAQNLIYSSWPLTKGSTVHSMHGGQLKSTAGATIATLDDVLSSLSVGHVDFIKIDVDGNELNVLEGGIFSIKKYRPIILMELAPYALDEISHSLEQIIYFINSIGYRFFNINSNRPLPQNADDLRSLIPYGAGINVIARPYQ